MISVLEGEVTADQTTEHDSLDVSVRVKVGAAGKSTAQMINGLDLPPSPIKLTAEIVIT